MSSESRIQSVGDLPTLLPVERDWLKQCANARIAGAILPSVTMAIVAWSQRQTGETPNRGEDAHAVVESVSHRSSLGCPPFLEFTPFSPAGKALASACGGAFIFGSAYSMAPTMCARDFASSSEFPTAAAMRQQIRQRNPNHYIVRNFDNKHPGLDAAFMQQGQTKLGRIPFETPLPIALYKELFENEADPVAHHDRATTSAQLEVQPIAKSNEDLAAQIRNLPSAPTATPSPAVADWVSDSAEVLSSELAPVARPAVVAPAPYRRAREDFFNEVMPSDVPAAVRRQEAKADKAARKAQATLDREQQRGSLAADQQQPPPSTAPRLKVKRNAYGDEVFEEETFADRQD